MTRIAVFDFDGTLYNKDSIKEFTWFVFKKMPSRIQYFPKMVLSFLLNKTGIISKKNFKEAFFCYLNNVDPDKLKILVQEFWEHEFPGNFNAGLIQKIKNLREKEVHIICASASMDFLLKDICYELEIDQLLSTRSEFKNNKYRIIGSNCRGKEKIKWLDQLLGVKKYKIIEAYSDNNDDLLLLKKADKGFLIVNNELCEVV